MFFYLNDLLVWFAWVSRNHADTAVLEVWSCLSLHYTIKLYWFWLKIIHPCCKNLKKRATFNPTGPFIFHVWLTKMWVNVIIIWHTKLTHFQQSTSICKMMASSFSSEPRHPFFKIEWLSHSHSLRNDYLRFLFLLSAGKLICLSFYQCRFLHKQISHFSVRLCVVLKLSQQSRFKVLFDVHV